MTDLRKASEMALEALEGLQTWSNGWLKFTDEIQALRQALDTEPEALRLADALDDEFTQGRISNHNGRKAAVELRRLALKQWVGLTEEEIQNLGYLSEKFDASNSEWFDRWGFARAIEAKLKEKNQ
jgi:hypothetical protein